MLGYFDLGLGTDTAVVVGGAGGGIAGIARPFSPGIAAEKVPGTLLKS